MARKKKRIGVIDCETDPFKYLREPKPFSWGFYDGSRYVDFWGEDCTRDLLSFLSDEEDLILYAHNGGKFDFFYLLTALDADLSIIDGRIAKATLFDGRIELRDSWLILPLKLATYKKTEISYEKFERECREKHKQEILNYLRDDCVNLYEWVNRFIEEFGNSLTLAGAAFKQLKKTGYDVGNTYDGYDQQFRHFYFGGRVQCFKVGAFKGEYLYIDINSSYPYAMMFDHWYGNAFVEGSKIPDGENGSYFAEIKAVSKGALPFRDPTDNKLYFPDDDQERTYCATGWEIMAGLETGTLKINKVIASYYPLFKRNFKEYVDKFFALKNQAKINGDSTLYEFAKLMLNACYGKLGQDGRNFEKFNILNYGDIPEVGDGYEDKHIWTPYANTVTGQYIWSRPDPQYRFYNVATAGSITGFARAELWRAICLSKDALYCDSDSIICKQTKVKMDPNKLGHWDVEARPVEVYIAQRKVYALKMANGDTKAVSKGVRLSYDEIREGVLSGVNITKSRDNPSFSMAGLKYIEKNGSEYGGRFFNPKTIDFKNINKNTVTTPS